LAKKLAIETTKEVKQTEGFIEVSRTLPGKPAELRREKLKVRPFATDTATVSIKLGTTIPTEPYANIKIDVMCSCPCYLEEMPEVFEDLKLMVNDLMDKTVEEMQKGLTAEPTHVGKAEPDPETDDVLSIINGDVTEALPLTEPESSEPVMEAATVDADNGLFGPELTPDDDPFGDTPAPTNDNSADMDDFI
jgi:hypothetical protein